MSDSEAQDKKVKRKKQKPRFTSVKKEELDQFLKDVNEYKQILKSIGMYDLCQNWKQKRNMERAEQKKETMKLKAKRLKEKEQVGDTYYKLQKNSEMLFEALGENDKESGDVQEESEQPEVPTYYQEYNKAYQNQQTLSRDYLQFQNFGYFLNQKVKWRKKNYNSKLVFSFRMRMIQEEINLCNQNKSLMKYYQIILKAFKKEVMKKMIQTKQIIQKAIEMKKYSFTLILIYFLKMFYFQQSLNQDSIEKKRQQSKKKANLISKSLKKHQFRSQENSQVGDPEQLKSDQQQALQDINSLLKPEQNNQKQTQRLGQNSFSESNDNDEESQKESNSKLEQQIHIRSDEESVVRETDNDQYFSDHDSYPQMDIEIMYNSQSKMQSQSQNNDNLSQNYKFPPDTKPKSSQQKNNKLSQNKYSEEDISSESYNQIVTNKNYPQIYNQKQNKIAHSQYSDDIENIDESEHIEQKKSQQIQKDTINGKKPGKQEIKNNQVGFNEDDSDDNLIQLDNSDQQTSSFIYIQDQQKNQENQQQNNKSKQNVKSKKIKKKK